MKTFFRAVWSGWKRFAFWLGDKQSILIYAVLYWVLVGPIALVRRAVSDPLQRRARSNPSFWLSRPPTEATLAEAQRQ